MAKQPVTLIAGPGRTVLQEDGAVWPKDGLADPDTLYTRRRFADGDLVAAPKPKKSESGES